MDQQPIIVRAAESDFEEGLLFARYLDTAAEGFMRFLFGPRFEKIIAGAYTRSDNEYSFQNVIVAELDGRIVGMASSFTAEQRRGFSDRPLKEAAGSAALRMGVLGFLCAPLLRILETVADGDTYLLAIAIDEESRGKGVGSALIDAIEDRARGSDSTRLCLDVSAKNDRARRLYVRRGMTVESEWPSLRVVPSLFVRMTKTL